MRPALLLLLLASGCRTPLLEAADASAADLPGSDLALAPDQGGACRAHTRDVVRLGSLLQVDGDAQHGRALRVRFTALLREDCDVLADHEITAQLGAFTDAVVLTAHAFRGDTGCGVERPVSRVVTLSDETTGLSSPRLVIRDGAPGSSVRLELAMKAQVGSCGLSQTTCTLDCHCTDTLPGARCLPSSGAPGGCFVPCNGDSDCAAPLPYCGGPANAPAHVCLGTDALNPGCDCPFGQLCQGDRCVVAAPAFGGTCACDADCQPSQLCARTPGQREGECVTPCATSRDCPRGLDVCVQGRCHPLD